MSRRPPKHRAGQSDLVTRQNHCRRPTTELSQQLCRAWPGRAGPGPSFSVCLKSRQMQTLWLFEANRVMKTLPGRRLLILDQRKGESCRDCFRLLLHKCILYQNVNLQRRPEIPVSKKQKILVLTIQGPGMQFHVKNIININNNNNNNNHLQQQQNLTGSEFRCEQIETPSLHQSSCAGLLLHSHRNCTMS